MTNCVVARLVGSRLRVPGCRVRAARRTFLVPNAAEVLVAELDWNDMQSLEQAFESPAGKATADDVALPVSTRSAA